MIKKNKSHEIQKKIENKFFDFKRLNVYFKISFFTYFK